MATLAKLEAEYRWRYRRGHLGRPYERALRLFELSSELARIYRAQYEVYRLYKRAFGPKRTQAEHFSAQEAHND